MSKKKQKKQPDQMPDTEILKSLFPNQVVNEIDRQIEQPKRKVIRPNGTKKSG